METTLSDNVSELQQLSMEQLRRRYRELFEEDHPTTHRDVLVRRIAWRLQSLAHGGLSDRARQRAAELAREADLRVLIPRTLRQTARSSAQHASAQHARRDPRLPAAGTVVRREYAGRAVEVLVLEDGFEYDGIRYDSLSAIATKVTGTRWNGFLFFGLARRTGRKGARR
jgi:hypothetical protein